MANEQLVNVTPLDAVGALREPPQASTGGIKNPDGRGLVLYEISTYKQEPWLNEILSTWRFLPNET